MSTIIKFDLKELRKLAQDKNSCVVEKKVTQNLALQPWCLGNLKESLKNVLDYKIGKFDKEFNGILLSYKNVRILQNIGAIRNDSADIHFQVQADYFIFKPLVGATLKGVVNKKSITHLCVLVHRVFNVVIARPTEQPGNKWLGSRVQEGQTVIFRIVVMDLFGALPYIRGELDERSFQVGPDGDDDEMPEPKCDIVSYVNFDKTRPHIQRQIGDGANHLSSLTPHAGYLESKYGSTKGKLCAPKQNDSDASMADRNKTRRQSKAPDMDSKQPDTGRLSKRHRKDM